MSIENMTSITVNTPPTDIGFWAALSSIILVGVLLWQVILLKKQMRHSETSMKLAYFPSLVPRYNDVPKVGPVLILENIGNGNAKDINITVEDENNQKQIAQTKIFAFKVGEIFQPVPQVNLQTFPLIRIKGYYRDVTDRKIPINYLYRFPPEQIDD